MKPKGATEVLEYYKSCKLKDSGIVLVCDFDNSYSYEFFFGKFSQFNKKGNKITEFIFNDFSNYLSE